MANTDAGTLAEKIPLEPIESSNLAAYGYNPEKQILAVQFKSTGVIFHYAPVPLEQAIAFGAAESKGKFYGENLRGKVSGQRMTGPCGACGSEGWVGEKCDDCGTAIHTAVPYDKEKSADGKKGRRPEGSSDETESAGRNPAKRASRQQTV